MRFLAVGDLQLTDSTPIRRKDDFISSEFNKLASLRRIAQEENPDYIFLLGDVFDKALLPLWFVNRIIQEFKLFNKPIYSIVGNHDVLGRVDGVHETALGNLFEAGIIRRLTDMQIDSWRVRGIDYTTKHSLDLYKPADDKVGEIIFSHNMITPKKFEFADYILASDISKAAPGSLVVCGHYHIPFNYKDQVINPGVVVRTEISEIDIQPSVLLVDTYSSGTSKQIPLNALAGAEVFNTEEYEKDKSSELNLQDFIDSIKSTQFQAQDIEAICQAMGKELKAEEPVITEVIKRIKIAKTTT